MVEDKKNITDKKEDKEEKSKPKAKKVFKKKVKKNIPNGIAHVNATFNNTVINIKLTTYCIPYFCKIFPPSVAVAIPWITPINNIFKTKSIAKNRII